MAGAPLGNQNAKKGKAWEGAIRRALAENDGQKLRSLAEKLIARAEEGDVSALKEIGDRMDGKPGQQVTLAGDPENPLQIEKVVREVVKPKE